MTPIWRPPPVIDTALFATFAKMAAIFGVGSLEELVLWTAIYDVFDSMDRCNSVEGPSLDKLNVHGVFGLSVDLSLETMMLLPVRIWITKPALSSASRFAAALLFHRLKRYHIDCA